MIFICKQQVDSNDVFQYHYFRKQREKFQHSADSFLSFLKLQDNILARACQKISTAQAILDNVSCHAEDCSFCVIAMVDALILNDKGPILTLLWER